jgi:hypothetical protein
MVIVTILGFSQGNPQLVLYPYDENGRQCGFGTAQNYPYLYFYEASSNFKSINVTNAVRGVCVSTCPTNYTGNLNCTATTNNPNCKVSEINFYVSVPCNTMIKFFSFRKILLSRSILHCLSL